MISGWLTAQEGELLAELSRDEVVLEIGSYKGKSTVAMLPGATHIYCVDHFHPGPIGQGYQPDSPSVRPEFEQNISTWKSKITILEMNTRDAVHRDWPPIGLLFVDGDHNYETVTHDIREFAVHAEIVAVHDAEKQEVANAIDDSQLVDWTELDGVGTIRVFEKKFERKEVMMAKAKKKEEVLVSARVIEVRPQWVLLEWDEGIFLHRRLVPQVLFPVSVRGPVKVSARLLQMGLEYSDVSLVDMLGETLPVIRVAELEGQLRRAGLWMREDYRKNPAVVRGVLQRLLGVDVGMIVNAANLKRG